MTEELLSKLKANMAGPVRLTFLDGEVIDAKRLSVLESDGIVAFELIRSNRPDKYEKTDQPLGLVGKLNELADCEPLSGRRPHEFDQ